MATVSYLLTASNNDYSFQLTDLNNGMLWIDQVAIPDPHTVPRIAVPSTVLAGNDYNAGSQFLAQIAGASCVPGALLVGNVSGRWSLQTTSGATAGQVLGITSLSPNPTLGWITVSGSGTVTSIAITSTDLSVTGSPITSNGTINLVLNTVPISKGGTGQSTKIGGFNALSPLSSAGDILSFDGANNLSFPIGLNGEFLGVTGGTLAWLFPSQLSWNVVTTSPIVIQPYNGYFSNGNSLITFILPTPSAIGQIFEIAALTINGNGNWSIIQSGSQQIYFGNTSSSLGSVGSLSSSLAGDTVRMVCFDATMGSEKFIVLNSLGNLTII